jgi:hypothetical protein
VAKAKPNATKLPTYKAWVLGGPQISFYDALEVKGGLLPTDLEPHVPIPALLVISFEYPFDRANF